MALKSQPVTAATVDRVAHHGTTQPSQMHPNLVGSPGFQTDFQQAVIDIEFKHLKVGAGRFAVGARRELLTMARITAQRHVDDAFGGIGLPVDQGQLDLVDGPRFKLPLEVA